MSWLKRRHKDKKAGAFGESVAKILLEDVELQAETLFAPRRLAVLRALDGRLRSIDFVNNPHFENEFRADMLGILDGWSEQADRQHAELKQVVCATLGDGISLIPADMLDGVLMAVVNKQRQLLIDAGMRHAEGIMKLQNGYNKLSKR